MATELPQSVQESLGLFKGDRVPFETTIPEADLRAEIEKARSVDRDSNFLNGFGIGVTEEHIGSLVARNSYAWHKDILKPIANPDEELISSLTQGLDDPRAIEDVIQAVKSVGVDYASKMADDYRLTAYNAQQLAEGGWSQLGGYFLASMTDPVEWAAIFGTTAAVGAISGPAAPVTAPVTAGVGAVAKTGKAVKKTYDIWKFARSGLAIGIAEAAAFEGIRARLKYDVDGGDVMTAMLIGGSIGGIADGVTKTFIKNSRLRELDLKLALNLELSLEEKAFYNAYGGDARIQKLINQAEERGDFLDPEDKPLPRWTQEEAEATTGQLSIKGTGWIRKRISTTFKMKSSRNGYTRLFADRTVLNSTGNEEGVDGVRAVSGYSASEIKNQTEMVARAAFDREMLKQRTEWVRRTGGGIDDFNVLVSRAIRTGNLSNVPVEVRKVAEHVIEAERNLGLQAIDYNVAGFTAGVLDRQPNYLPRLFQEEKIQYIKQKYGNKAEDVVAELVEAAIRKGQPKLKLKAESLKKMARGYAKTILSPNLHAGHRATEFNVEDLKNALKNEQISDQDINDIIDNLTLNTVVKGHKRARPRVVLDENTSIQVRMDDGRIEELSFLDLLEEDIEKLHNAYVFQMSSAIGLARNGINTNELGSSFDTIVSKIQAEGERIGQTSEEIADDIRSAKFVYDYMTGRLGYDDNMALSTKRMLSRVREASFIVNMGMSGMSSMMEITNALFEYSLPVLLKAMPHYRRLYAMAADGKLSSPLLREMEAYTGLGADVVMGKFNRASRFEGDTMELQDIGVSSNTNVEKLDEYLGKGREQMSYWSGLSGVTQSLRRLTMLNYSTAWARAAKKGMNPFSQIKMEQLGIDAKMSKRIRDSINKHATFRDADKTVLETLNLKTWDDKQAADLFSMSIFRETTQSVQEMNIGSVNRSLRGDLGKTVFQFLSFPLAAVEQQTMRLGVRAFNGDAATVSKIILSGMLTGSMLYITRVYMNAEGRGDKEEYIKRMLAWDRFLEGSMSQVGSASFMGYIYQLTTGAMDGNNFAMTPASLSLTTGFLKAAKLPFDENVTEAELRSALRLLPFSSLYGARQIINGISDQFTNTN
jgi:hypothetical protein